VIRALWPPLGECGLTCGGGCVLQAWGQQFARLRATLLGLPAPGSTEVAPLSAVLSDQQMERSACGVAFGLLYPSHTAPLPPGVPESARPKLQQKALLAAAQGAMRTLYNCVVRMVRLCAVVGRASSSATDFPCHRCWVCCDCRWSRFVQTSGIV